MEKTFKKITVKCAMKKWPEIAPLIMKRRQQGEWLSPAQKFARERGYSLADLHNIHERA